MWQSALLVFSANQQAFFTLSERDANCISKLLVPWCTGHSGGFCSFTLHMYFCEHKAKAEWNCNPCINGNLTLQMHRRTRTEQRQGFSPEDIRYHQLRNYWLDLCQAARRLCSFEVKNSELTVPIKVWLNTNSMSHSRFSFVNPCFLMWTEPTPRTWYWYQINWAKNKKKMLFRSSVKWGLRTLSVLIRCAFKLIFYAGCS